MNWADEPATWKQLRYLEQLGHHRDHALTKNEAAELIQKLGGQPEKVAMPTRSAAPETPQAAAYSLRLAAREARDVLANMGPAQSEEVRRSVDFAIRKRQAFWIDSCRGAFSMETGSEEALRLYRQHGCRFVMPTHQQVQLVLDALDAALLSWDRDYPQLFYQTLELNFPELARRV